MGLLRGKRFDGRLLTRPRGGGRGVLHLPERAGRLVALGRVGAEPVGEGREGREGGHRWAARMTGWGADPGGMCFDGGVGFISYLPLVSCYRNSNVSWEMPMGDAKE